MHFPVLHSHIRYVLHPPPPLSAAIETSCPTWVSRRDWSTAGVVFSS